MRYTPRFIGVFTLLALLTSASFIYAQDENVTVVGSAIVEPLFQALADSSDSEASLSIDITGTNTGFSQFCANEADIVLANRQITSTENNHCETQEIGFVELLIGHNIVTVVANPAADFAQCLDIDQLNNIFAPSAAGDINNWSLVLEEGPDTPLSIYVPGGLSPEYAIIDNLIEGDGLRADASIESDASAILSAVSADEGALGIVGLNLTDDTVQVIELDAGDIPGCQVANAQNVEDNLYPAADRLYVYVNTTSLSKTGLTDLLSDIASQDAAGAVEAQGFTAPTSDAYEQNQVALEAGISGEPIPRAAGDFALPSGVVGAVQISGAAGGFDFIRAVTGGFSAINPEVTVNLNILGEPAGFRSLCNGEADMVTAYRDLNEEETGNCAANTIESLTLPLATEAVVMVANGATDFLGCLATTDIATAWAAQSDIPPADWSEVNTSFAETPITLFAPALGDMKADVLLLTASGSSLPIRADIEVNADPLYRAAATANVEGGITYMSWFDYQSVLSSGQQNIQLVAVDGGDGCVAPSTETIADGSYPLTRSLHWIINRAALANPEVQALVWYIYSNENYPLLEANDLVGVRFGDLPQIRTTLQTAFEEAEAAAILQAEAEATAEATLEADATAEATEEAAE